MTTSRWDHARTGRLRLDRPRPGDLEGLHAIHADPASWTHLPSGRHDDLERTRTMLEREIERWEATGLGPWTLRALDDGPEGPVLGLAGCGLRGEGGARWWNLGYRLATAAHGQGHAGEVARRAVEAAADVGAAWPVVAYLLEHNLASRRTAERLGLDLVWRGPDAGNPDPAAVRLVFADRPLDPATLASVVA